MWLAGIFDSSSLAPSVGRVGLIHLSIATAMVLVLLACERGLRSAPSRLRHRLWSLALWSLLLPVSFAWLLLDRTAAAGNPVGVISVPRWLLSAPAPITAHDPTAWQPLLWSAAIALWLLGSLAWIGRVLFQSLHSGDRSPQIHPAGELPPELQTRLRAAATLAGVALPHIAWTPAAVLPSVRGLVHPRIVVPWFALETLETQELAAVLAHEDAHRRARDPWHLAIQRVAFVLFYFFPPLWLVLSRLHETSELACDEDVLARGLDPRALARAIARSVTVPLAPRTHDLLSAPVGLWSTRLFHRSLLKERLHRLETMRRYPIMHRHHVVLALAGTVFGLALILPLGLRAEEKPDGATIQLADRAADLDGSADERSDSERSSDERAGTGHSADLAANDTSKSDPSKNERVDELEEGMTPPKPTHMVPAEYPKAEHAEGVSGRINLQLVVDEQGHPTEIEVVLGVPGHPAFGDNAVAAMRQWKFEPATKDDEPVAMKIIVPFLFQLD